MILCSSAALRQAALLCRADARPYRRPLVSARATRATGATTDESKASGGLKQRAAAALVAGALLLGSPDPALAGGASPLVSMLVTPAAITVEGFPTQLAMPAAAPETPELRPPKLRLPELQRPPQAPPRGGLPLPPPAGEDADVGQGLRDLADTLRSRLAGAAGGLKGAPERPSVGSGVQDKAESAAGAAKQAVVEAVDAACRAKECMEEQAEEGAEAAMATAAGGGERADGGVRSLFKAGERAGEAAREGIVGGAKSLPSKEQAESVTEWAGEAARRRARSLKEGVESAAEEAGSAFKGAAEEAGSAVKGAAEDAGSTLKGAAEGAGSALKGALGLEPSASSAPATASPSAKDWVRRHTD